MRYAIGLGSNVGQRLEYLRSAVALIGDHVDRYLVSSLYETEPVGGPDQDPFLNGVMVVDTSLGPGELLELLQKIEKDQGREREVRWGPRTLDLDILTSDGPAIDDESLTVPHPRASERAFVLVPLAEIWPEAPVGGDLSAAAALNSVDTDGVDRLMGDWLPPTSRTAARLLVAGQVVLFVLAALALAADGELPDGQGTVLNVIGALVAVSGLVLALVASRRLGRSLTPMPLPAERAELVIAGPYRHARHPIYGGVVLVLIGAGMFLESLLGVIAASSVLVFFWFKTFYEERHLRIRFAGYRRYREIVSKRLIPFVI